MNTRKKVILFFILHVLAIVFAIVAVHEFIGPSIVRNDVEEAILTSWDGKVEIGEVAFHITRPIKVSDIRLLDEKGFELVRIDRMEIGLGIGDAKMYKVKRLALKGVRVETYVESEGMVLPPWKALGGNIVSTDSMPDEIEITDGSYWIFLLPGSQISYRGIDFSAVRNGLIYNVQAKLQSKEVLEEYIRLGGTVDPGAGAFSLDIDVDRKVNRDETAFVLPLVKAGDVYFGQGRVQADFNLEGKVGYREGLKCTGKIEFFDWNISKENRPYVVTGLHSTVVIDENRVEVSDLEANVCGGKVHGSVYGDYANFLIDEIGGHLFIEDVDLKILAERVGSESKLAAGKLGSEYTFWGEGLMLDDTQGFGMITIEDGDLFSFELVTNIFSAIGLSKVNPAEMSDAVFVFKNEGAKVTFSEAELANTVAALTMEPGGMVDLSNGMLDMYVIGVPIKGLDSLMKKIPVLQWAANAKDKLIRLGLKGHYKAPRSELIKKEPIQDMQKGVIEFFSGVVETGGKLSEGMQKVTKSLFDMLLRQEKKE